MSNKSLITDLPFFTSVERRVGQMEALLIAVEYSADKMDEISLGQAISGIRALNISLYSELESVKKYEQRITGVGHGPDSKK